MISSMAAALQIYCFCVASIACWTICLVSAQDNSQFIYNGFKSDGNLHMSESARIHPNGLLQLTTMSELDIGHAFHPTPIKFNTSSLQSLSFSTCFVFSIVDERENFGGQGVAFVVTPSMDFSEAVATGYLGIFNATNNGRSENRILAVEFDTVITPEFNDISGNHVGINLNSLISNHSANASYFSVSEGKNITVNLETEEAVKVWIDYDGSDKLLNVIIAPFRIGRPTRPLLSTFVDLSRILNGSMYVGFSSSTGTRTSEHYVLGWSFNQTGQAEDLDILKLPQPPQRPNYDDESNQQKVIIIVVVVAAVVVLMIAGVAFYIVRKERYEEVYEDWEKEYGPQRISYKNLYVATKGFTDLIGQGGFGKVYKGVLPSSGDEVAVKRVSHDAGGDGMKQFVAEIASMGRLRHRNLVQLRGYCRRKGELLLAYDFMPNGSLDKVLYSNTIPNLNWFQRFQILRGVASGLLYLHEEWEQVVLHRDIKPGNVLLDAELNAKLGDFGLARLYDHDSLPQTTNVVGTVGYLAPELLRTGQATTKTDVFAFGAFMLEMACGRRPIEPPKVDLFYIVIHSWNRGDILDVCDHRLEGIYVEEQMELVLKLGLFCAHIDPEKRPSMRQVMQYLDGDAKLPDIPPDTNVIDIFRPTAASSSSTSPLMSFSSLLESNTSQTMSTFDAILTDSH